MGGFPLAASVVKQSRVLAEVEAEATPYEATPLAKKAHKARPRLALLVGLGAAGFAAEGALARDGWMLLGAAALALVAWGVWKGRLGAVIATGFVAVLAFGVPLALMGMDRSTWAEKLPLLFVTAWSLALLPDLLTLIRDAELQNAYGMWARR